MITMFVGCSLCCDTVLSPHVPGPAAPRSRPLSCMLQCPARSRGALRTRLEAVKHGAALVSCATLVSWLRPSTTRDVTPEEPGTALTTRCTRDVRPGRSSAQGHMHLPSWFGRGPTRPSLARHVRSPLDSQISTCCRPQRKAHAQQRNQRASAARAGAHPESCVPGVSEVPCNGRARTPSC